MKLLKHYTLTYQKVTQSAFNGWHVHLSGARKILDGMNIVEAVGRSTHIRAQVATLLW